MVPPSLPQVCGQGRPERHVNSFNEAAVAGVRDRRREQQKHKVIRVEDTETKEAEEPWKLTAAVEKQVAEASAPPSVSNKGRQESRSRGREAKAQSQQPSSNDSSGGVVRRL